MHSCLSRRIVKGELANLKLLEKQESELEKVVKAENRERIGKGKDRIRIDNG